MSEPKKKKWKPGVDMPLFSGKSWKQLEDIWPRDLRLSSEAWMIVSVFAPAWYQTKQYITLHYKIKKFRLDYFFFLCWIQRCEEGRENIATPGWPVMKGLNIGGKLWVIRKSSLTKYGLIENLPLFKQRLYRVTPKGKTIIRVFIENVEQAHKDVRMWIADQGPLGDQVSEHITKAFYSLVNEKPPTIPK